MKRSVAAIVLDKDRFLLAKRVSGGEMGGKWEFPGGKVEDQESDEEAIRREMEEEFGVEFSPVRLLGESVFKHNSCDRVLAAWLCYPDTADPVLELREHTEFKWLPHEEICDFDLADSDRSILHLLPAITK